MPQTTLQHSGCGVVSAVKTIWLPPPSRLPPAKPRTVSAPFRSGCPAPSHLSGSMPLCIPFRSTLSLPASSCTSGPFPPARLSAPLSLFTPAARGSTRSSPFTPVPSFARLRPPKLFIEKAEKCADFFVFSFPRPIFVLQIRLFYLIPTHSLPTGLTNTQ